MAELKQVNMYQMVIRLERIKKLLEAGHTASEIAKELSLPESTVRCWVSEIESNK